MNTQTNELDREQWLTRAAHIIQDELITPNLPAGHQIQNPFRVSVGFPPRSRANTKTLAVCIKSTASADQHNEIFVTPAMDDSIEILASLVHELVHQADDCQSGHQNFFARVARRVGLEGKLTATHAGQELQQYLQTIVDDLGNIPHAKIDLSIAKKKQTTRLIKVQCVACDWNFRISNTQLNAMTDTTCLSCGRPHALKQA